MGMILRGIFLCRDTEIKWFYQEGASRFFPDYWEEFLNFIPETERHDLVEAYHKRLNSKDELMKMSAAKHWAQWEAKCATLQPCQSVVERFTEPHVALSLSRIENHYFVNNTFIQDNQILDNMHRLHAIPSIIVHGRYDMICPIENAFDIHRVWPTSELHIIREAGHSAMEPAICSALLNATSMMASHYR
jgi:proline iminopeptidase